MDQLHFTTTKRRKGQHLTFEEKMVIQVRLKDGWSANKIAKEIGCAPNTVRNEIKRRTCDMYNGHIHRYKAQSGQEIYEENRKTCCRHYGFIKKPVSATILKSIITKKVILLMPAAVMS